MNLNRASAVRRARGVCRRVAIATVALAGAVGACATIQQLAALRSVDFSIDRTSRVRVAGVDVSQVRSFADLSVVDAGAVVGAVARGELPLDMTVHVRAENPAENGVTARLIRMDWALFLEERKTVSGVIDGPVVLPPGAPTDVPVDVHLDLIEFFEGSARDLFDLTLRLTGLGGEPKDISIEALPTIETSVGPIRYPSPIRIRTRIGG